MTPERFKEIIAELFTSHAMRDILKAQHGVMYAEQDEILSRLDVQLGHEVVPPLGLVGRMMWMGLYVGTASEEWVQVEVLACDYAACGYRALVLRGGRVESIPADGLRENPPDAE